MFNHLNAKSLANNLEFVAKKLKRRKEFKKNREQRLIIKITGESLKVTVKLKRRQAMVLLCKIYIKIEPQKKWLYFDESMLPL